MKTADQGQDFFEQSALRPTRQRLDLARLLFVRSAAGVQLHRHVTAEQLYAEATAAGCKLSLATVYNCLNQFTRLGMLRESLKVGGKTYYDTNTADHHHFYLPDSEQLVDIDLAELELVALPQLPAGLEIERIEVVIRLRAKPGQLD